MELVAAEKHQQEALKVAQERNKTLSMLEEILEDVRRAADRLEEEIEDHVFDNNKQVRHQASLLQSIALMTDIFLICYYDFTCQFISSLFILKSFF